MIFHLFFGCVMLINLEGCALALLNVSLYYTIMSKNN
jgi:hypothetical protein